MGNKLIGSASGPDGDWHLNACVGNNTGMLDNSIGYSEGFRAAAELMLKMVGVVRPANASESWGEYPYIDALVYPICYSARHHVELALKRAIPVAWKILTIRFPDKARKLSVPRGVEQTHSIQGVWQKVHAICEAADNRLEECVSRLKEYVDDLEDVDSTGQTFRYASEADTSLPHLSETRHINLQIYANRYSETCRHLESLEMTLELVLDEYLTGSFTKKLNREQLVDIAKRLPARDQWETGEFSKAKSEVMSLYCLSSNDFQKACVVIQSRRGLASIIGVHIPIPEISSDTFRKLLCAFEGDDIALNSFEDTERSALFALYRIGCGPTYPEYFDCVRSKPRPSDEGVHSP